MEVQFLFCVVLYKVFVVRGEKDFTLTTASIRQSTSAKPTSMFRRLNIQRFTEASSNSSPDFFKLTNQDVKKNRRGELVEGMGTLKLLVISNSNEEVVGNCGFDSRPGAKTFLNSDISISST